MATNNPKVSAYVPQPLKDRLEAFRREQGNISESFAVTAILAQYFGIEQVINRPSENAVVGGVTLARMEALEKKLIDLTESVEARFQQLEEVIKNLSELPVVHKVEEAIINNDLVVPLSELLSELSTQQDEHNDSEPVSFEKLNSGSLLSEQEEETTASDNVGDVNVSLLAQEGIQNINGDQQESIENEENQVEIVELNTEQIDRPAFTLLGEPLENNLIEPVSGELIAIRFGMSPKSMPTTRNRHSPEKFREWTIEKDPSNIPWKFRTSRTPGGKRKSGGYLPDGELTSEQKSELLQWLQNNNTK